MKQNEITIKKGNLITLGLQDKFNIIAHGANCFRTMGAGIAASIKSYIPEAYDVDFNDKRSCIEKLGNISYTEIVTPMGKPLKVINIYSQFFAGGNLDYDALTLGLRKVNYMFSGYSIGLPKIGCGIAGGDFDCVKKIIEDELKNMQVTIIEYDNGN